MADEPGFIDGKDRPDFALFMREFRANGKKIRTPKEDRPPRGGRGSSPKFFARPITSESDDTPATVVQDTVGWFQPEYGPRRTNAGDPKGAPIQAGAFVTCPSGSLCVLEKVDGDWYAAPRCEV